MCMRKEHNRVFCCVFSEDEAPVDTNAPKAEGLEEVIDAMENDVRKLKYKLCHIYNMSHHKLTG